ncbi:hypothetical protein MJD09_16065, partial [bacterium]|nr:hypothetical protein [bacterium]
MKGDAKIALLVLAMTAVSRLIFAESDFGGFSYDSGSYALAVQSYDLSETRPHLPGYYLHVQAIKLVGILTGGTHRAMITLSVLYSSVGLGLLYLLLRRWFEKSTSILLTGLTFSNPMVWFYGCVSEVYAFDLFFSVALTLLCLRPETIYLTPFFLGFLSGVRPSSGLLMLPLYVFFWYRHFKSDSWSMKSAAMSHLLGIGGFLLWFIPMVESAGGINQYFSLY